MRRSGAVLLCTVLWTYPITVDSPMGRGVVGAVVVKVCEGSSSLSRTTMHPVLEVWRELRFTDGTFIGETLEVRLPWGSHEPVK